MNRFEQRSAQNYDTLAAEYDKSRDGRFTLPFKQHLARHCKPRPGAKVLDVACGNGRFLRMLAQKYSFSGYGVDISQNMVQAAKALNPGMQFFQAGCDALPFEDGFFDELTVCAAFHHFPCPAKFVGEARRVLGPGGRLYLIDVYLPAALRVLCNPFFPLSRAGDVKLYAPKEVQHICEKAGFQLETQEIEQNRQLAIFV